MKALWPLVARCFFTGANMELNIVDNRKAIKVEIKTVETGAFYIHDKKLYIKTSTSFSYDLQSGEFVSHSKQLLVELPERVKVIIE